MINEVQENLWLFEFEEDGDKQKVLAGRPWSCDRTLLVLNEFDRRLAPSQMEFQYSPIWVQIHNMLLECMNRGGYPNRTNDRRSGRCSGGGR
jgi:hypothetical protein